MAKPRTRLAQPWRAWMDEHSRLATGACGPLAIRLHRTRQLVAETSAQMRRHRRTRARGHRGMRVHIRARKKGQWYQRLEPPGWLRPLRHLKPDRAGRPAVRRHRHRREWSDRQASAAATERSRAGPVGRRRSGGCRYCKRPRPNPSQRRARYHTKMETHAATTGHRCRGCRRTTSL